MTQTQEEKVLEWLKEGKPITSLMAVQLFGCMSLSRICSKLKKKGYCLKSNYYVNSKGHALKQYFLEQKNDEKN